jgi:hypothetical protein
MRRNRFILVLLLLLLLIIGLILADDYGISWDEPADRMYAEGVRTAYSSSERIDWKEFGVQNNIGPAYLMAWTSISNSLGDTLQTWDEYTVGHFINFLTFLLGTAFFFILVRQFFESITSGIITILLLFQPVLFGHAFINQKDIPFMTAFMGAISFGVLFTKSVQRFEKEEGQVVISEGIRSKLIREWNESRTYIKIINTIGIVAALLSLFLISVSALGATSTGTSILNLIGYQDNPLSSLAVRILSLITPNHNSVVVDQISFHQIKPLIFPLIVSILIAMASGYKLFPRTIRAIWTDYFRGSHLAKMRILDWVYLLLCAAMVGVASSMRVLGPFAGLLVLGLIILNHGFRLPIQMGMLLIFSLTITYLTWPFLWDNPIRRYLEIISLVARHPWRGFVLFDGVVHPAEALPWYYIPKMLALQLSEPLIILTVIGFFSILQSQYFTKLQKSIGRMMILWFFIPISIPVFGNAIVYDNFRQFLFALPPLFVLAGFGLDRIFRKNKLLRWKLIIGLISLLLGVIPIIKLHPYQYMYYNELVGGVQGAYRNYELDYWCTSYQELFEYINVELPSGAELAVWGPVLVADTYAREDLVINKIGEDPGLEEIEGKYLLLSTRHNTDLRITAPGEQLFEVVRDGVPLARLYNPGGDQADDIP